jgi:carbamoyl-phosphate synthase large subunit
MELTARKKLTVLVTGSDAPGFSSIVRSLLLSKKYEFRIIATDWKQNLKGKFYAEQSYLLPDNKSPEFFTELYNVCKKEKVDIILPIRTDDQLPICTNLEELESIGTIPAIITPNPKIMETATDKLKMLDYLNEVANLETMRYRVAKTKKEFEDSLNELGYPQSPVAIKPCKASGSRGFRILDSKIDRRKIFFEEKPTGIYSTKDEVLAILGETFPPMLLMEYLAEPEYTIDTLCYKGRTFAIIPRKRIKMTGGITTKGIIEKLPEETNSYIEKLIEAFGFSYSVGLQIRKSQNKKNPYHVLEINPRLQGTTVISVAAGVNVPELIIDMVLKEFNFNFKPDIKYGLKMERAHQEFFEFNDEIYQLSDINKLED